MILVVLLIALFLFYNPLGNLSPPLEQKFSAIDSGIGEPANGNGEITIIESGEESEDEEECSCPINIYYITVNGINTDLNHPIHKWIPGFLTNPPVVGGAPFDPYNHQGIFGENDEWCHSDPRDAGKLIDVEIERIRKTDPCAKFILVGHSLGAWGVFAAQSEGVCRVKVAPPMEWYPFGGWWCKTQRGIDDLGRENMRNNPGYIPTKVHDPWTDPTYNECSEDLKKVRNRVEDCLNQLLGDCTLQVILEDPCPLP